MRLSQLLGSDVVTIGGAEIGTVHDVRLAQRGPIVGSFGAGLSIDALLVGPGSLGARLGYGQGHVRAPWVVASILVRRRAYDVVDWRRVQAVEEDRIIVDDEESPAREAAGRVLDAAYALLDRQIVDRDGMMAGKVDDLTMRFAEDGSGPYVVAITSGAGALASRYGGRAGRALARLHDQLRPEDEPSLISFGVVQEIVPEVIVTVERADLVTMRFEAWCRKHVIGRLPGS
jgi:sporulation protein YlmC with PRC-barrel domain